MTLDQGFIREEDTLNKQTSNPGTDEIQDSCDLCFAN